MVLLLGGVQDSENAWIYSAKFHALWGIAVLLQIQIRAFAMEDEQQVQRGIFLLLNLKEEQIGIGIRN